MRGPCRVTNMFLPVAWVGISSQGDITNSISIVGFRKCYSVFSFEVTGFL